MGCSRFVTSLLYGVLYRINKNYHVFTALPIRVTVYYYSNFKNNSIFTLEPRKRRACALLCTDAEKGT